MADMTAAKNADQKGDMLDAKLVDQTVLLLAVQRVVPRAGHLADLKVGQTKQWAVNKVP